MFLTDTLHHIQSYLKERHKKRLIHLEDLVVFFRQFAALMTAGVPIIKSCELLEKSQEKARLRQIISMIKRELLIGKNLFNACKQHVSVFDSFTCQLIKIGEHTGKLEAMLQLIAIHYEKKSAFKKQLKQILFYPSLLLSSAIGLSLCMLLFIVPKFAELFQEKYHQLPLLTRIIFSTATFLNHKKWLFILPVITIIFLFAHPTFFHTLQRELQQRAIKLPFIKTFWNKLIVARFTRYLMLTYRAGLPLDEAIMLAANASTDHTFTLLAVTLNHKIKSGLSISHALQPSQYFPPFMIQMIQIGEESGKLEEMLSKIADLLETEVQQWIHYATQLLEPLIMAILGVLIGGLVVSMYLPIFKLGAAI